MYVLGRSMGLMAFRDLPTLDPRGATDTWAANWAIAYITRVSGGGGYSRPNANL
jgi:hypothetical protein